MACVGVALALRTRSVHELGGSGGMLPQENLDLLRAFLVLFEGTSEASGRLDGELYLSMIQVHCTQSWRSMSNSIAAGPTHFWTMETGRQLGKVVRYIPIYLTGGYGPVCSCVGLDASKSIIQHFHPHKSSCIFIKIMDKSIHMEIVYCYRGYRLLSPQ